jgi:hypothetical protein
MAVIDTDSGDVKVYKQEELLEMFKESKKSNKSDTSDMSDVSDLLDRGTGCDV